MVERFCDGIQSVLVDAATTTIAGYLKTLLEQRGIETVTVGRTWGTVGVDKQFDVTFDCVGGEMGRRVARVVKPDGVVVHYGLLSGERELIDQVASRIGGLQICLRDCGLISTMII